MKSFLLKTFFTSLAIIFMTSSFANAENLRSTQLCLSNSNDDDFAIVTYAGDNIQERSTRAFIKSVRELAGKYSKSKIYVVLQDVENFPCNSLKGENVILLPLKMDEEFKDYPLAIKAFAAAQVEGLVKGKAKTLAWFDPATLVLGSLNDLNLSGDYDISIRPVTLMNTIGIAPESEPNDYWSPIYNELGIDYKSVPTIETIVESGKIQAYYNCEIFSVNPRLGLFEKWKQTLIKFLQNEEYQNEVCATFLRKLFLHQAVLSGVIDKYVSPERIKPLPITSGYPFNQHEKLPDSKKVNSLNEVSAIIFDYQWERNSAWGEKIPVSEPLKTALTEIVIDYLKLSENLYRIEGSCNSYLITTKEGSVLIDPAGAAIAPQYFRQVIKNNPLKAILLTHAHQDHWDNMELWHTDKSIPIIAQREFNTYNDYWKRFHVFFERRGAIWGRKDIPTEAELKPFYPVVPSITFGDEYMYELGGYHFKMTHTPGETPDHATIWIPELSAVFVGDNYFKYFINNATLRGTLTRPVLGYINAMNLALSYSPEYFLPGHDLPEVSKNTVKETVTNFKDAIQFVYDETIKGINEGKDVYTLMQEIKLPEKYGTGQYFGKVEWTVRGIYQENIGWFDENPSSMYSIPPSSIYADLVQLAGGGDAVANYAKKYLDEKEYVKVLHITDAALKAEPDNKNVLELRLEALESLKAGTRNYIERIWLDYGIKLAKKAMDDIN